MIRGDSGSVDIWQRRDELQQFSEWRCRELKRSKFNLEALKGPHKKEVEKAAALCRAGISLF